ncbi:MAG: hypothetical protein JXB49_32355 [Bacteroidales bacterium]|nr:hypothetical protein [Bacteroidales bacterium]
MKLKKYNANNSLLIRDASPRIRFSNTGAITISVGLTRLMGLKNGSRIELLQNPDSPKDWYIAESADGFILRLQDSGALICNCAAAARSVIKSLNLTSPPIHGVTFPVSSALIEEEGTKMHPIITLKPINFK